MEVSVTADFLRDPDEPNEKSEHVSHARVNRYLQCPEQYRLYYLERLRPRVPSASLVFGNIVHQALAKLFLGQGDPVKSFLEMWTLLEQVPLDYSERSSWEKLMLCGERLLRKFLDEEMSRIGDVTAVEKPFEISITGLSSPFVGVIDLVADLNHTSTVVDFKTAASSYSGHEVMLADQLTAYRLAEPAVEQMAFCVLVKTKEPKIEWHTTRRTGQQLTEYLAKVGYVAGEIGTKRFYKRPGTWCAWCDYLPVCLGDTRKAKTSLVRIQ